MIETKRKLSLPFLFLAGGAVFCLLIATLTYFRLAGARPPRTEPIDVVKAYLKANYARDYENAYRYISAPDQLVWNETSYVSQSRSFTGFALELAQTLAESMEIWVMEQRLDSARASYRIGYKVPTVDELSSLLFNWDPDQLNALSRSRQEQLLEAVGRLRKDGKMIMIEGQETVDLVSDEDGWKIFLDWASGIKVTLKADTAASAGVEARFVQNALIVKKDEPFQIDLKITNRSKRPIVARIVHRVEPRDLENHIDMIACGALRPLTLQPGEVQEISSGYLIRNGAANGSHIGIIYEFKQQAFPATAGDYSKKTTSKRNAAKAA